MDNKTMMTYIDHTELKAFATWSDIQTLCTEAIEHKTASVCIPATYVKRIQEKYADKINICTVIGFPLGYSTTNAKVCEAETAIKDGASEIDMVINISDIKNGDYDKILSEVKAIRKATEGSILKVIIETCYLTEDEKIKMCEIVTEAKADYIKTSTGFGTGGATMADVLLFKKHIGPKVKIKAAGGVRSVEDLANFIEAGCSRIGTSSAIKLLTGSEADGY